MARIHLFEFEDFAWFPDSLRRAMTRYLRTAIGLFPFSKIWAEKLASLASPDGTITIVDLGSGSGGALGAIVAEFEKKGLKPQVTLTDLYPNPAAADYIGNAALKYWPKPVDALSVPEELSGIRTMFLSFHHHRPEKARAILRDAFERRRPICIFEGSSRKPLAVLSTLQVPVAVLLVTLLIRPVRPSQLMFTYLIPIIPILMFWDALVSHLRVYEPEEMLELTADMKAPDYAWEMGELRIPGMPGAPPYLIGRPSDTQSASAVSGIL